jgi:UDP-N-acetylmuramate dehydrogenase
MQFLENISLKSLNTFGVDVKGRYFTEVFTEEELFGVLNSTDHSGLPFIIIGGGSNLLFTKDFDGIIVKLSTKGVEILRSDENEVIVSAQAGENWDEFVGHCVEKGWGGLENLSLIPGNVGTSPVQNIGAYGAEIKDVLAGVRALDRNTRELRTFTNEECEFGYRESIFKKNRNKYIILSVTFRLSLKPIVNLSYKDLREELERRSIASPDIRSVREVVCDIRRRKLPDPVVIGNSGSFFKNPVIGPEKLALLKEKFPGIISFPQGKLVKLAAAWMIEQCGWKGYRDGDAGVHPNQPLVLVNYGNATGQEIFDLGMKIRDDVEKKFGITLENEVNII